MSMYLNPERVYSKLNLLGEEWKKLHLSGIEKLLYKLAQTKQVMLNLAIPKHLFFRAEILVEDIREESEIPFTQSDLIYLLYDDFLKVIKKSSNVSSFYQRLSVRESKKPQIQDSNGNVSDLKSPSMAHIPLSIPRKAALRGEVFLADLEEFYPDHPFQLEDVLQIIYTDFLIEFKRGAVDNVVEKILKRIENE